MLAENILNVTADGTKNIIIAIGIFKKSINNLINKYNYEKEK